jgi:hypothetical protein
MPTLQLLNCLWPLLPVFAWNTLFAPRVPQPILLAKNLPRIAAFVWPLLLPLSWQDQQSRAGLALCGLGLLIYCVSWLPLLYRPETDRSRSAAGLPAPAYTPLLWLLGITLEHLG